MRGRFLASLLVGAISVVGGAGAGWGEPRPADRIIPVEPPPLAADPVIPLDAPPTASTLQATGIERPAPLAVPGTSLGSSVGSTVESPVASSAQAAPIDRAADPLTPVGGLSDIRSKP